MTILGQINRFLISNFRVTPNNRQLNELQKLLSRGVGVKELNSFMKATWKVKVSKAQLGELREILSGGAWTPNENRVDYVVQVLTAVGMLWCDDPFKNDVIRKVAEYKLKKLWSVELAQLPIGHEMICARVFWDTVCVRFPNRAIGQVLAIYNETVNRTKKPKRVDLTIQPRAVVERILFTL